jgi:hypothetical protein
LTFSPGGALAQIGQQEAPPAPELIKEIQSRLFELNWSASRS